MSHYDPAQDFLNNLKHAAKIEKRASGSGTLNQHYDRVARIAGFQNWSLFSSKLQRASHRDVEFFRKVVGQSIERVLPSSCYKYVENDVIRYFRDSFELCEDFSSPDDQTENLYSHPSVPVEKEARSVFAAIYSDKLLSHAINRLNEIGPWCENDSDLIFEYEV